MKIQKETLERMTLLVSILMKLRKENTNHKYTSREDGNELQEEISRSIWNVTIDSLVEALQTSREAATKVMTLNTDDYCDLCYKPIYDLLYIETGEGFRKKLTHKACYDSKSLGEELKELKKQTDNLNELILKRDSEALG